MTKHTVLFLGTEARHRIAAPCFLLRPISAMVPWKFPPFCTLEKRLRRIRILRPMASFPICGRGGGGW